MELVEQGMLPALVQGFGRVGLHILGGNAPHFSFTQGQLGLAVAALDGRLGGIHAAVALKVQFAHITVDGFAVLGAVLEELLRGLDAHLGNAFQVAVSADIFEVIAGGAAAAVAIAEGQQEAGDAALLHAVAPALHHGGSVGAGGVVHMQEGRDGRTVHALPGEVMVGEAVAAVVAPEDLLGGQILHACSLEQLGQHGGVAEGIRQPQQLAVHAKLFLIEALAVHQLTHQGLAGGHVGVRLDPHGSVGDPLAGANLLLDALVQLGVELLAHLIGLRLALQKLILRVNVHQANLLGEGTGHLALGLTVGPEPAHVQMGVADGVELGRRGTVVGFHHRAERFAGADIGLQALLAGLLEVHDQCELFQGLLDLSNAQAGVVQHGQQIAQGGHVLPQLVGFLVPDAEGAVADLGADDVVRQGLVIALVHADRTGGARPDRRVGELMAGVGFHQQMVGIAGHSGLSQDLIGDVMVLFLHPVSPAGTEGLAVDEHGRLAASLQIHHNGLSLGALGDGQLRAEPAVLPVAAPGSALGHGDEFSLLRIGGIQHVVGTESLEADVRHGLVEFFLQGMNPIFDSVFPFRNHGYIPPYRYAAKNETTLPCCHISHWAGFTAVRRIQ